MNDKIRDVIAAYDAAHRYCRQEKREREIKAAEEAEQRAQRAREARRQVEQQQTASNNSKAWCECVDQRIREHFELYTEDLTKELGDVVAIEREGRDKEVSSAVEEAKRWVEGKLEAKLAPLEGRVAQHLPQYSERADAISDAIAAERAERQKEIKTAVDEIKRAVEAKLETLEKHIERYTEQCNHRIAVSTGRAETLARTIETERADRQKEIKTAVEATRRAVEAKLAASEQRIVQHADQRIIEHVEQCSRRTHALGDAIATERADLQKEVKVAIEETHRAFEMKLTGLEKRLKAVPGKLPVAKTWRPETVVYQAEFVSHEGALWQARKDSAQTPGGSDWVCVARAGRDAVTPVVCGTYNVHEKYRQLDIVALDGGSFIATCDDPGICPGKGWQLLCKQGKTGRPGAPGERGARGERGEKGPATMPQLVSSKIDENYNLVILRSDDSLEIIPLREGYERYYSETSE